MKRTIVFLVAVFFLLACKKESNDPTAPKQGVLKKDDTYPDQKVSGLQTDIKIGSYLYTTGDNGEQLEIADAYDGTVSLDNFTDVRIVGVATNKKDSFEMTDPTLISGWWNPVNVLSNTTYRISVYVTVQTPTAGTLISGLQVTQGNFQSEVITGQTTTFRYYKVQPVITGPAAATTLATNGSDINFGTITVSAPDGSIASKGFSYRVQYADNGVNDTLRLDSLLFYKNNQNITNLVTFVDSLGNKITKLSELIPADTKLYVTFTSGIGESITKRGTTDKFEVRATVQGLGSSSDGDAIRITPLFDDVVLDQSLRYPVKNGSDFRPRLGKNPSANTGTIANYLWSDMSEDPHSGIYGVASGDWKNGAGIDGTTSSVIYHSKMMSVNRSLRHR